MKTQKTALKRAISLCGGVTKTAKMLGVDQQVVSAWLMRSQVSHRHVVTLSQLTNGEVSCSKLRPDIFGKGA